MTLHNFFNFWSRGLEIGSSERTNYFVLEKHNFKTQTKSQKTTVRGQTHILKIEVPSHYIIFFQSCHRGPSPSSLDSAGKNI